MNNLDYSKLRELIVHCKWTFAKTMPYAPHEYIVKNKCPLTAEEFEYFVNMQREHGVKERWGKYNNSYLYIDDYKYWTMGAPLEETTVINRAKVHVLNDALKMHDEIVRIRKEVEDNRPYHFNALLNSSPLEPNVSSIFAGFLRQKSNGQYSVLKSFIKFCFGDTFTSGIEKPIIETEKEVKDLKRIDILIYEKSKYAIVIENKIWDATEQPNQLTNYIKGMKEPKFGFTDNQIYIVYMPSTNEHKPTNASWSKSYQQAFESRYRNISFRDGVIGWLESDDIQAIDDVYFSHSRFLFIDFLKRVFKLTETDNMQNQKIEEYIQKELGLKNDDNGFNIAKLTAACNEVRDCANQLERMRREYGYQIVKDICVQLEKDYSCYTILKGFKPGQYMFTGIAIPYKDKQDAICVQIGFEDKNFIYGATYATNYRDIRNEMQEWDNISRYYLNGEFKKGVDWLFFKGLPIDNAYDSFKQLVETLLHPCENR